METNDKYNASNPNGYTYVISITKHVAVKARSGNEALNKVQCCEFSRIGRDEYKILGKLNNTDKETD